MKLAAAGLVAVFAAAAQLPVLRIDATDGGSVVYIRNTNSQPLTAFQIELVDYPGSSFTQWQDEAASGGIPAGAERAYPTTNMLIGASPDYVKVQAVIYADGSSGGIPEKIAQLIARRGAMLETNRELIRRFEKTKAEGGAKADLIASLKQWSASLQPVGRGVRITATQDGARFAVAGAIARLDKSSIEDALSMLRREEQALAASKPSLAAAQ
jgi:hypothetical protein